MANSKVYGGSDPALTYTLSGFQFGEDATSAGVSGSVSCTRIPGETVAGSPYTISCDTGTLTAANYVFAAGASADFTITPATVTVTPNAGQSKVYGGSDPVLGYTFSALANGDTSSVFSGALDRAAGENVGAYAIGLGTLSAGSNYTTVLAASEVDFTITPATVTVTPNAGQSKVYGGSDPVLGYTFSALANGDTSSVFSGALDRAAGENVGAYAIGLGTLSAGSNYTTVLAASEVDFTITPATVTVTPNAGQSKVYGGSDPVLGYTFSALANGDTSSVFSGALDRAAGENVGAYAIGLGTLSAGSNYTTVLAASEVDFTITPATVTVTPNAGQSKVYGGSDPVLGYTFSALANGDTSSVFSGALDRAAGENVGAYAIGLGTLSAGSNYTTVLAASEVDFTITPATVTVTPNAGQSKVYGGSDPVLGYTFSALANGDTSSVFSRRPGPRRR